MGSICFDLNQCRAVCSGCGRVLKLLQPEEDSPFQSCKSCNVLPHPLFIFYQGVNMQTLATLRGFILVNNLFPRLRNKYGITEKIQLSPKDWEEEFKGVDLNGNQGNVL